MDGFQGLNLQRAFRDSGQESRRRGRVVITWARIRVRPRLPPNTFLSLQHTGDQRMERRSQFDLSGQSLQSVQHRHISTWCPLRCLSCYALRANLHHLTHRGRYRIRELLLLQEKI